MRNLKLLNRNYLSIIFIFLLIGFKAYSEDPVDIWNIENKKKSDNELNQNQKKEKISKNKIYEMQSQKNDQLQIEQDKSLTSKGV